MPRIGVAAACLALLGLAAPAHASAQSVPGELIVRFEPGVSAADRADARADADVALERGSRLPSTQLVEVERGQTVGTAERELEEDPRVRYAEANTVVRRASTPDDPLFGSLWGLHNTGQLVGSTAGAPDADIDAPEAWDVTKGSAEVVVAVADTGIAYDHPDLGGRIWSNAAEASGTTGVDDDSNGYVDDVRGWDAIDDDPDPRDIENHGTHVAGTVGAAGGNGVGITGVAQNVKLMPLKVLRPSGGDSLSLAEGFDYAGDMGAQVVNASLSGPGSSTTVNNVVASHPNTLFVAAAGNDGEDVDQPGSTVYPCNAPGANVLCVAATDQSDQRADFSNHGAASVDLAAPGTSIRSSLPAFATLSGSSDGFEGTGFDSRWNAQGGWGRSTAPKVSGTYSASDSPTGNYKANVDATLTRAQPYDLTGKQGCRLDFRMRLRTELNYDFLRVETSSDGATWRERDRWSGDKGDGFGSYSVDLGRDGGPAHLRFRFTSDELENRDGVHLDDIVVRCSGTYSSSSYGYFGGTSMAAPHVTGAAALIKALRPSRTVGELRDDLLEGGDQLAGLADVTESGGRLNAMGALRHGGPLASTLEASPVGERAATLRGQVNPVGANTSYRFRYGLDESYGSETEQRTVPAAPISQPVAEEVGGLEPATTYHYRVVSSRDGITREGQDRTFTTAPGPDPPGRVVGLEATPAPQAATLDWDDTANSSRYEVFVRASDQTEYPSEPYASPSDSEQVVTGLVEGREYCFQVRARNFDGPGPPSDEACATPQGAAPDAVPTLTAAAGVRSAKLAWAAAQRATGYRVFRRPASEALYPVLPRASVSATSFDDSGLTAGTTYCYRIQSTNAWGQGALSPERCVTPTAPPTTPPTEPPTQPAPAQPASPPAEPVLVDLARANRTLRAGRSGLFTFSFRATPGLSGRASFATARRVRLTRRSRLRTARLGSRSFRASSTGTVRVRMRLGRNARALLRRSKRLRVKATISAGGQRKARTFTLKAPRR